MEVHEDDNPRPAKRLRLVSQPSSPLPTLTPPTPIRTPRETHSAPSPLPPVHVLLALPSLLLHPPTHRDYPYSLCLSLLALRRCLAFGNLEPELECRAWTATAELGIQVIKSGFCASEWAVGVENEAERAVTKGVRFLLFLSSRASPDTDISSLSHRKCAFIISPFCSTFKMLFACSTLHCGYTSPT